MVINYTNFGNFRDDWDDPPPPPIRPQAKPPQTPTQQPANSLSGTANASMVVDSALLPLRLELSDGWRNDVSANRVGSEIMNAYLAAVNRRCSQIFAEQKSIPRHEGIVSTRQRLMALLETRTWEQYTQVQDATLGVGSYRVTGPTEVNDEPVMTIKGTRFLISSIQVWSGWGGCAEPWMLESEVMACVQQIRELHPKPVVRGDYSHFTDDDLAELDDRHRMKLIESRAL